MVCLISDLSLLLYVPTDEHIWVSRIVREEVSRDSSVQTTVTLNAPIVVDLERVFEGDTLNGNNFRYLLLLTLDGVATLGYSTTRWDGSGIQDYIT